LVHLLQLQQVLTLLLLAVAAQLLLLLARVGLLATMVQTLRLTAYQLLVAEAEAGGTLGKTVHLEVQAGAAVLLGLLGRGALELRAKDLREVTQQQVALLVVVVAQVPLVGHQVLLLAVLAALVLASLFHRQLLQCTAAGAVAQQEIRVILPESAARVVAVLVLLLPLQRLHHYPELTALAEALVAAALPITQVGLVKAVMATSASAIRLQLSFSLYQVLLVL
jgi:hypothetical protein